MSCSVCQAPLPEGSTSCPLHPERFPAESGPLPILREDDEPPPPVLPQTLQDEPPVQGDKASSVLPSLLKLDLRDLEQALGDGDREVADPSFRLEPGAQVGEYLVEERIAQGGMGEIWRGYHPPTRIKVAIKILSHRLITSKEFITRFLREARTINELRHENLVDLLSVGELPNGLPYFVMEFLEGKVLNEYIEENGPLPFSVILEIFGQLCQALGAAHDRGIIHRDVKPDNIFLLFQEDRIFVKVLDFGIAKLAHGNEEKSLHDDEGNGGKNLTRTGQVIGTPAYMSPEQCRGESDIGLGSDLYALGVILFEMICARTPFRDPSGKGGVIMMKHMAAPPPPASAMVQGRRVPPGVDRLLAQALAKKPSERPERPEVLFRELKAVVDALATESWSEIQGAAPLFDTAFDAEDIEEPTRRPRKVSGDAHTVPILQIGHVTGPEPHLSPRSSPSMTGDYYAGSDAKSAAPARRRSWSLLALMGGVGALGGASLLALGMYLLYPSSPQPILAMPLQPEDAEAAPTMPSEPLPEKWVRLVVTSEPAGAEVFLADKLLGETPLDLEIPYSEEAQELRVEKTGYEPRIGAFTPNTPYRNDVFLKKRRAPKASTQPVKAEEGAPASPPAQKGDFEEKGATPSPSNLKKTPGASLPTRPPPKSASPGSAPAPK